MSIYSKIKLFRPRRTVFNLSHQVNTAFSFGQLVPTARPMEMVPGDTFDSSQIVTVELMPLVHPFKGDLYLESWQFFVSNDILEKDNDNGSFSDILLTAQNPKDAIPIPHLNTGTYTATSGSLIDHMSLPVNVKYNGSEGVCIYPLRAYYKVWDEYFRDENLQDEVFANSPTGCDEYFRLLNVNYKKDRFTSAFTTTQKGNPITLSLGKSAPINIYVGTKDRPETQTAFPLSVKGEVISPSTEFANLKLGVDRSSGSTVLPVFDQNLYADISSISGVTINDLRLLNKLQKWEERNQLAGSRPKEYLLANYGTAPSDETLQRPVLIGHTKTPVIVNSVIQNNPDTEITTGNKTGNGVGISKTRFGKWTAKEFGWLITLSCLRPKASYTQGINRQLIKDTVYDFFNPIFCNLGQQEIYNEELFMATDSQENKKVFGFTDRYNEMRHIEDSTTGVLRSSLNSWAVSRKFAGLPTLSDNFIQVQASEYNYLFNFNASVETPQAIVSSSNIIKAVRPIPKYPNPTID